MTRNDQAHGSFYVSEISSASLYVYWAQAIKAHHSGINAETLYTSAWEEWNQAATTHTPPEMKSLFKNRALDEIKPYPIAFFITYTTGMVQQIIDSGTMKWLARYQTNLPLSIAQQKRNIITPSSISSWLVSCTLLGIRLCELIIILTIFVGCFITPFIYLKRKQKEDTIQFITGLAFIVIAYLFILSSGPASNVRFREQYFSLAIFLASPALSLGLTKITETISHAKSSYFPPKQNH